jgi:hypothetical protein
MSFKITFTKEMIAKAEKEKARDLSSFLSKFTYFSDKKFPSSNLEILEKEFKKNVLKED